MRTETENRTNEFPDLLNDRLIDLRAVAYTLGIGERTVWRGVASGTIPKPVRLGRCTRWFVSDITDLKQRLKNGLN